MNQYVIGDKNSGEVFEDKIIGITRKLLCPLPNFVEVGPDCPITITEQEEALISAEIGLVFMTLGVGWGPLSLQVVHVSEKSLLNPPPVCRGIYTETGLSCKQN